MKTIEKLIDRLDKIAESSTVPTSIREAAKRDAEGYRRLLHLGRLKNGMPRHPLHTAYAVPLQEFI